MRWYMSSHLRMGVGKQEHVSITRDRYDNLLDDSYWFRDMWYKIALPFIVWLQIPFFHGAEYIFLHILCPIFGLHVHRFQYAAAPWQSAPEQINYITYSKNITGFVSLVQHNFFDASAEKKN
eukprot:jgi/Bigna1/75565/fgenesh1_pg.35_\